MRNVAIVWAKAKALANNDAVRPWLYCFAIGFLAICIVAVWYGYPTIHKNIFGKELDGERGDTYGSLNTLFSGLAFAALVITLVLQSKELQAQRKELKASVEALEAQKSEMEKSRILQAQPLPRIKSLNFELEDVLLVPAPGGKPYLLLMARLESGIENPTQFPATNVYVILNITNICKFKFFLPNVAGEAEPWRATASVHDPARVLREAGAEPVIEIEILYMNILGATFRAFGRLKPQSSLFAMSENDKREHLDAVKDLEKVSTNLEEGYASINFDAYSEAAASTLVANVESELNQMSRKRRNYSNYYQITELSNWESYDVTVIEGEEWIEAVDRIKNI